MGQTAYHFFLTHAGYSYDPKTQTPMQGRRACASLLAEAERKARDAGCSFSWDIDPNTTSRDWCERGSYGYVAPWETWRCLMRNPEGDVVESLCGIDFGRLGGPWGDPYRRVVEAELACEWLAGLRGV